MKKAEKFARKIQIQGRKSEKKHSFRECGLKHFFFCLFYRKINLKKRKKLYQKIKKLTRNKHKYFTVFMYLSVPSWQSFSFFGNKYLFVGLSPFSKDKTNIYQGKFARKVIFSQIKEFQLQVDFFILIFLKLRVFYFFIFFRTQFFLFF